MSEKIPHFQRVKFVASDLSRASGLVSRTYVEGDPAFRAEAYRMARHYALRAIENISLLLAADGEDGK